MQVPLVLPTLHVAGSGLVQHFFLVSNYVSYPIFVLFEAHLNISRTRTKPCRARSTVCFACAGRNAGTT